MGEFREVGIIRDPQPNDVLVVTVPRNTPVPDAAAIKQLLGDAVDCKVVVVSDGIRVGDDGAAAELAALKARRCDGCEWANPMDAASAWVQDGSDMRICNLQAQVDAPMLADCTPRNAHWQEIVVRADHACNAWTAKP